MMNLNVRATMALSRVLLPQMRSRRFGRIISIGSVVGSYGTRGGELEGGGATYAASKAALEGFTKGIAHEGGPWVTANVISPGPTNPLPQYARTESDPPVQEADGPRWLGMRYLSGRRGVAEDVAHAVSFFAARASSHVTGQTLHVSGGLLL